MREARKYWWSAVLVVLALLAPTVLAAGLGVTMHKVDASQFPKVRVYVSVANEQGMIITNLNTQNIELLEDGKPISGFTVESIVDSQEPIAVALNIDVSGSMADAGKLDAAKQAASAFVNTMGPNDVVAVAGFDDEPNIVQGYTGDEEALKKAIGQLAAKGDTSLYDAIIQSAQLIGALPQQRRVIIALTDGEDTKSKQSIDAAIAAAKQAGAPVLAIGLGQSVKTETLDKIGSETGGQAVYVASADELRQAFLAYSDQLRRQYVLQYSSALPADDQAHAVGVKVNDRGRTGEAKGSFTIKKPPLAFDVKGIANASEVGAAQHRIEVAVTSGTAKQVELLVDEQPRASANAAPFILNWDAAKEKPGMHRVVIRAKDAAGAPTDKEFVVSVAAAAAATVVPTVAPQSTPAPSGSGTSPLIYLGALAALLGIAGGIGAYFYFRSHKPAVALPRTPVPAPNPDVGDMTEVVPMSAYPRPSVSADGLAAAASPYAAGATIVAPPPPPRVPKAKLHIVHEGVERDVPLDRPEMTLGREEGNPIVIKDALASRRHAKIVLEDGKFWIEDLKSMNGTLVNGERITRRELANGDLIKVGSATLTFTVEQS